LEIVEQTSKHIVAQDFLDLLTMSIQDLMLKIDNITRTMLYDSRMSLYDDLADNIYVRDEDVNRLTFLSYKMLKNAFENNLVRHRMKMNASELLCQWLCIQEIEHIADSSKRIARHISNITFSKKEKDALEELYQQVDDYYRSAMSAFYKQDEAMAILQSRKKKDYFDALERFKEKVGTRKYVPELVEQMKSLIAHTHEIMRIIFSHRAER